MEITTNYIQWWNGEGYKEEKRAWNPETISGSLLAERPLKIYLGQIGGGKMDDLRIRKLTPRECWRLMGRTDEDFEKAEKVCSDSQLYKQAGNSIVVDVLVYLFDEIFKQYPAERNENG